MGGEKQCLHIIFIALQQNAIVKKTFQTSAYYYYLSPIAIDNFSVCFFHVRKIKLNGLNKVVILKNYNFFFFYLLPLKMMDRQPYVINTSIKLSDRQPIIFLNVISLIFELTGLNLQIQFWTIHEFLGNTRLDYRQRTFQTTNS